MALPKPKTEAVKGLTHNHHKGIFIVTILLALVVGLYIGTSLYNNLGTGKDSGALTFGLLFTNTVILIILTAVVIRHHSSA